MRTRNALVACLLVVICVTGASAQSDVMCICSEDESASSCGGNIDLAAFSQATIWFCLLGPSESEVLAWEAQVEIDGDSNIQGAWTMLGGGLNFGEGDVYIVGLGGIGLTPNSGGIIPLMSMTLLVLGEDPVKFYIRRAPGSHSFDDTPGYLSAPDNFVEAESCGGDLFAFTINSAAEDEEKAWGEVKSLYGD